ncbi:sigma factor-like helix-turn-helix DNA-binding protein [Terribacillus saccharophilus]|uniref:sigma factor-like helix-turn-helix DNA-binding protein n=1 Tax=Terribacillus saccharophilus TaxID=361277 RepID=UPI003981F80C
MEQPKKADCQLSLEEVLDKLSQYCLYLTKNKWDSEEVMQEAVVKTITKYSKEPFPPPVSLLKKIAYNAWIDRIRKQKKEKLVSEIQDFASARKKYNEWQIQPLNKLTPKQLIVFVLKEAFQFQSAEIAALLQTNESAVKSLLHRGRTNIISETIHPLVQSSWEDLNQEELLELVDVSLNREDPAVLIRFLPNILRTSKTSLPSNSTLYLAAA